MQMSPFEFVTIFCSLILGLALSHILRAVTDLYEIRDRVKTYWLNSLWVVTVTMWSVYAWWGLWELSIDLNEWHYAQYWFLVTNLASIYFFTTLVLPKATDTGEIDLEKHYYSVHQAFFSIVAFSLFTSSAVNYSLFDQPMMAVPTSIVGCAAVAAAFTESRNYHKFIGIFVFIMFIVFQATDVVVIRYSV
jgi:hypothetical protein